MKGTTLTPAQEKLRKKHGTPAEYEAWLWGRYEREDDDVTAGEVVMMAKRYRMAWKLAGDRIGFKVVGGAT